MNTELFRIKNLVFQYGQKNGSLPEKPVLQIPSLTIRKNCVTVIRGHNGSGKSTLLKLLNKLLIPTAGEIRSSGNLHSVLVQQEPYLFHGSVLHNLTAPLRFRNGRQRGEQEKVLEALKMVGLEGFEKRRARELSGGEKKRIAIARALVTDPDVLLLDEPDANVDNQTSRELETLIGTLKNRGISIILCSHNRGFAYRTCDDMVDLYQGIPVDHDENIFKGIYRYSPGMFSEFVTGDWSIRCPSLEGEFSTLVIPPESVTLISVPQDETGGNVFTAGIQRITPVKQGIHTLSLRGPADIRIRLSDAELTVSGLKTGDEITLLFNPSSVKLY